jgi:hypothetical protein
LLSVSTHGTDIVFYPDSGKVGVGCAAMRAPENNVSASER